MKKKKSDVIIPVLPIGAKVIGFDLGTHFGWSIGNDGGAVDLSMFDTEYVPKGKGKNTLNYERVAFAFDRWASELFDTHKPDVVCSELPPAGLHGNARLILLGMHWTLRVHAGRYDIPMYSVPVTTLKVWATTDYRADKPMMIKAAGRYYNGTIEDDNHADAILVRQWGYERYVLGKV